MGLEVGRQGVWSGWRQGVGLRVEARGVVRGGVKGGGKRCGQGWRLGMWSGKGYAEARAQLYMRVWAD